MSGDRESFWFADLSDPEVTGSPWQPFIQVPGLCLPLPIWFTTKEKCEDFIRRDILTASPWLPRGPSPRSALDGNSGNRGMGRSGHV